MGDALSGMMWVALGGAIGGPLRFFVSGFVGRRIGETFPWGTLAVNLSGAFVIGVIAALAVATGFAEERAAWLLAVTGLLGSYTTVSSFSLQTLGLVREGKPAAAAGNIALSLLPGLIAVAAGYALGSGLAG